MTTEPVSGLPVAALFPEAEPCPDDGWVASWSIAAIVGLLGVFLRVRFFLVLL
jgi:hypothetical protein